jgi:hypothetical protein
VDILQYFGEHGNKAAERRLKDVKHTCDHLGILLDQPEGLEELHSDHVATVSQRHSVSATTAPSATIDSRQSQRDRDLLEGVADNASEFEWRQALTILETPNEAMGGSQSGADTIWDASGGFDFDFSSDFNLTGADVTDWELFERQISRSNG